MKNEDNSNTYAWIDEGITFLQLVFIDTCYLPGTMLGSWKRAVSRKNSLLSLKVYTVVGRQAGRAPAPSLETACLHCPPAPLTRQLSPWGLISKLRASRTHSPPTQPYLEGGLRVPHSLGLCRPLRIATVGIRETGHHSHLVPTGSSLQPYLMPAAPEPNRESSL